MVRLTLPVVNHVVTENVQSFVADLRFCTITDKLAHGSPFLDVILQCGNKFAVRLNPIGIGDQTLGADEDLRACGTIVNGWCVRENGISCDRFIASVNIDSGKARLEVSTKRVGTRVSCPTSRTLESVLDGCGRDPTEEATKLFILLRSVSSCAALFDVVGIG